jgi:hypothetical protein
VDIVNKYQRLCNALITLTTFGEKDHFAGAVSAIYAELETITYCRHPRTLYLPFHISRAAYIIEVPTRSFPKERFLSGLTADLIQKQTCAVLLDGHYFIYCRQWDYLYVG